MTLLLAALVGCLLGAAYGWYLWFDVRRAVEARRLLLRRGAFLRLSGVGIALSLLGRTGGPNLIAALAGLMITRTALVCHVGRVGRA
jgi:hypothetical protein